MYVPWGQELRTKEKEEEARRRRGGGGGKKTRKWNLRRVMTLAVRPKTLSLSLLLQCLSVWGVCARYAPRDCRKNCLGMRWVCAARLSLQTCTGVCAGGYAPRKKINKNKIENQIESRFIIE